MNVWLCINVIGAALLAISLPSIVPGWAMDIPFGELMSRLARFLLLPAAIGVTIRRLVPDLVTRYADLIRSSSLLLLLLLIGLIISIPIMAQGKLRELRQKD